MLALQDYECVLALSDEGHFGRAARRLGVTQPALSARLRRIEEGLDARLFTRDRGGVRPTPAGLALMAGAERVLAAAAEAERTTRDAHAGLGQTLRLGMTQVAAHQVVVPALAAFRTKHPRTRIRLSEDTTAGLERMLEAQVIDAVFIHPPLHAPGLSEKQLLTIDMARFDGSDAEDRPLIRYPRAEAPVLMGALARSLADDHDAGDRFPAAEANTILGAIVLGRAGFGPFTAPQDYPMHLGMPSIGGASSSTGIMLETAIAWRSLDRRAILQDLIEAALVSTGQSL